jgi:hypothetical protein
MASCCPAPSRCILGTAEDGVEDGDATIVVRDKILYPALALGGGATP